MILKNLILLCMSLTPPELGLEVVRGHTAKGDREFLVYSQASNIHSIPASNTPMG